jgi:hypothetical protein
MIAVSGGFRVPAHEIRLIWRSRSPHRPDLAIMQPVPPPRPLAVAVAVRSARSAVRVRGARDHAATEGDQKHLRRT